MHRYANRIAVLENSAIRDILKSTERPDIISFAGGLPNPATFPVREIREAVDRVLTRHATSCLQYGQTEGYGPLREWIAGWHSQAGSHVPVEHVLVTTGSQQAFDLLGKVLLNPGDRVLVETPTFLGATQAFSLFGAHISGVASDDDGLIPDAICPSPNARFLYTIPSFQNPTGRLLPLARRQQLVERANACNLMIVEDDPYGDITFSGPRLPSLRQLDPNRVIHIGSFSKILAPGLRLGYVIAAAGLIGKLAQAKRAADLHTPSFTQCVVHEIVREGFLDTHIPRISRRYRRQCETMMRSLREHMPSGVRWNSPLGGMFLWLRLPHAMDATALLARTLKNGPAFVPGAPFYVEAPERETLRLSYVTEPAERIEEGIARLGSSIRLMSAAEALPSRSADQKCQ